MRSIALVAAVALVYGQALGFAFVRWDDFQLVVENPLVASFSPRIWTTFDPELYVPLTLFTYQIEHMLFGFSAAMFHVTSVALHAGNVLLVFWILRRLLERREWAFAGALLFALHPLNVEAVAWVSGRKELLMTFFFLASLAASMRAASPHRGDSGIAAREGRGFFLLSIGFFLCALLAKVTAITLPAVLILLDWMEGRPVTARSVASKWPYIVLALIFGWIALQGRGAAAGALPAFQVWLLGAQGIVFTLRKALFPIHLSAIYAAPPAITLAEPLIVASLATLAGLIVASVWIARRDRRIAAGFWIVLITLLPGALAYLKSDDVTLMSDRYAYLPMVGLILCALAIIDVFASRRNMEKFLLVIALILAPLTFLQAATWRSTETLFTRVLQVDPHAHIALNNLGNLAIQNGDLVLARERVEAALREKPDYPDALINLAVLDAREGKYDAAEASLAHALALRPGDPQALFNLAGIAQKRGENQQAVDLYRQSLALRPGYVPALWQLAQVLLRLGRADEARDVYAFLLSLDDGYRGRVAGLDALLTPVP